MEELEALLRAGGDAPAVLRHIRLNTVRRVSVLCLLLGGMPI